MQKKRETKIIIIVLVIMLLLALLASCSDVLPTETEQSTGTDQSQEEGQPAILPEEISTPTPTPAPPLTGVVDSVAGVAESAIDSATSLDSRDWVALVSVALIILIVLFFGKSLIRFVFRYIAKRTKTEFDDELIEIILPQLYWFFVVIIFEFTTIRLDFLSDDTILWLGSLYFSLYLGIGLIICWKLIDYSVEWYQKQIAPDADTDKFDRVLPLIQRVAHIALLVIVVTMFLSRLGVDVTALIAALGLAGLALSLAAQDTIADMISGFVIYMDQPFRIGDRIEIQDLGTWGDVVEIGTRTTRIRTRDNRLVIVPNSKIADGQVVNYTYPDPRYRVQIDIGIGYGMDIEKTRQIIIDTVSTLDGVLKDKPVDALYNEMGDSSMLFRVRWWIESYEDTRRIYDRVNTALQTALDEAGIDMPYPTEDRNLRIVSDDPERISDVFKGSE
jgi:small-conductance mechanosensitive channel